MGLRHSWVERGYKINTFLLAGLSVIYGVILVQFSQQNILELSLFTSEALRYFIGMVVLPISGIFLLCIVIDFMLFEFLVMGKLSYRTDGSKIGTIKRFIYSKLLDGISHINHVNVEFNEEEDWVQTEVISGRRFGVIGINVEDISTKDPEKVSCFDKLDGGKTGRCKFCPQKRPTKYSVAVSDTISDKTGIFRTICPTCIDQILEELSEHIDEDKKAEIVSNTI